MNADGQASGISFNIQLKGTGKLTFIKHDMLISLSLSKSTLNLFSKQLLPTIVIVIDIKRRDAYWNNSFDFLLDLDRRNPRWRTEPEETASIHIPKKNKLSIPAFNILRDYIISIYSRRTAVSEGTFALMQPSTPGQETLTIADLEQIVAAQDYSKFIQVVIQNPFYYLSDTIYAKLLDLIDRVPPLLFSDSPLLMGILCMANYLKGYYPESNKWGQKALSKGVTDVEIASNIKYILAEIQFLFGHITDEELQKEIDQICKDSNAELRDIIFLRKIRLIFWRKDVEAKKFGRFRQMTLIKDTISELRLFLGNSIAKVKPLTLLELSHFYSILAPVLWQEIATTASLRARFGLQLNRDELVSMKAEAEKTTDEATNIYKLLISDDKAENVSTRVEAEGLLSYSLYIYNYSVNSLTNIILYREFADIPSHLALSPTEKEKINIAKDYCVKSKSLFQEIDAIDRVIVSSIYILAYLEDLEDRAEYDKLKDEIETLLKICWSPTSKSLFDLTVNQGSLRTRLIRYTSNFKKSDFDTADMTQEQIEEQVESNAGTFKISEPQRIENLRKDIKSVILTARFHVTVCKHFELLQDRRHLLSLETLYSVDPDRIGSCKRFNYRSSIPLKDAEAVIVAFRNLYCDQCKYQEPVMRA